MAKKAPKKAKQERLCDRVSDTIQICGRKFTIAWVDGKSGGQFNTVHPETKAGLILVGDDEGVDEFYPLSTLIHEISEAILALMELRYRESEEKMIFAMTHAQFTEYIFYFTRALLETKLIKVRELGDADPK